MTKYVDLRRMDEMSDILQDLQDAAIDLWMHNRLYSDKELCKLLMRAADEIQSLRQDNSDMGWRLNPDRMGGQFSDDEKNNTGWI